MENLQHYWTLIQAYVSTYGLKVIGALFVLIVGLWIIRIMVRSLHKGMTKRLDNPTLVSFAVSFIGVLLKVMLVISIMGMIGIEMTSFIAVLGAAGLAVGMALSGTLQNFAGGVLVLTFKPYKVGDFIEALGHAGVVKEIQIFNTVLNTPDNKIIFIPNGKIYSESITNFSHEPLRRVDFKFGIGYDVDYDKAKAVLQDIISKNELILTEPQAFIGLVEMADSSVNIVVRVWVEAANYWSVFFSTNETVFKEFSKQGINIPYPQMDVHIKSKS